MILFVVFAILYRICTCKDNSNCLAIDMTSSGEVLDSSFCFKSLRVARFCFVNASAIFLIADNYCVTDILLFLKIFLFLVDEG